MYQADFGPDVWVAGHPDQTIVIQCADEAGYDEIVVDVEEPLAAIERLPAALARRQHR